MKQSFVLAFLIFSFSLIAQQGEKILALNGTPLEEDRYKDFKGSPFYFTEFANLKITSIGGVTFDEFQGNINGLEDEFEVIYEGKKFILPAMVYHIIEYNPEDNPALAKDYPESILIKSKIHPDIPTQYYLVHYESENITVLERFTASKYENVTETPGQTVTNKKIQQKADYFIKYGEKVIEVKLNKKQIAKELGIKSEIESAIEESGNKLKDIGDLASLIALLDAKSSFK